MAIEQPRKIKGSGVKQPRGKEREGLDNEQPRTENEIHGGHPTKANENECVIAGGQYPTPGEFGKNIYGQCSSSGGGCESVSAHGQHPVMSRECESNLSSGDYSTIQGGRSEYLSTNGQQPMSSGKSACMFTDGQHLMPGIEPRLEPCGKDQGFSSAENPIGKYTENKIQFEVKKR